LKRYEVGSLTVAYGSLPKAAVIQQLRKKENEKLSQLSRGALRLTVSTSLFKDACGMLMSAILEELQKRAQVSPELASSRKNFPQPSDAQGQGRAGLVITGKTLEFALQESLQRQFLELTAWCQAVICCRATPLQKSEVVKLVRNHLHVMTLAIGEWR
jgi:phospholipid-translocating ATPase